MTKEKRSYDSSLRKEKALENRKKVLAVAKKLFEKKGFKTTSLADIAEDSGLAKPTLYALFASKDGILLEILDSALSEKTFGELVSEVYRGTTCLERFQSTAKLSRTLYEAESSVLSLFQGASLLSPEIKNFQKKMESRRYERQKESVEESYGKGFFKKKFGLKEVRDIIWSLTSRDLYKLFVLERKWTPSQYETWLADTLYATLAEQHENKK
jgi:AcrR family transcriptional regulator